MKDAPREIPIPIAELEQGPSKFEEFLDKNQKKLVILATLIFLGVLAYVFFSGLEKKKAADAGAAFMQATDEESLKKIITDHSSTAAAGTAAMAIAQLRTTDNDRIAALDHFINNYPSHPGVPAKLLEIALIQMNTGKNIDAKITLDKLISHEKSAYLIPRAKIALADIEASNNELEKAEQIYTEVKESKNTHFSGIAAERLTFLKATDPVLVNKTPDQSLPIPQPDIVTPLTPTNPESSPSLPTEIENSEVTPNPGLNSQEIPK